VPTLADSAGPTSGAMTIAPTTTAAESSNSPAVATSELVTVRTRNVLLPGESSRARMRSSAREIRICQLISAL
jgi:hypothetical protein